MGIRRAAASKSKAKSTVVGGGTTDTLLKVRLTDSYGAPPQIPKPRGCIRIGSSVRIGIRAGRGA